MIDAAALERGPAQFLAHFAGLVVPWEGRALDGSVVREAGVFDAVIVAQQPVQFEPPETVVVDVVIAPAPNAVAALVDGPEVVDAIDQEPVPDERPADGHEQVELVLAAQPFHGIVAAPSGRMFDVGHVAAE